MKTVLEEELGSTFAARAASLPPEAAARVRAIEYHPRRHRRALPVSLGGATAGAATAGTVLAVVLGGAAPAYGGWSATPASTAVSTPAEADCLSSLSNSSAGSSGSVSGTGAWQALLTDVRGPFTIVLLQSGPSYASCFTGPSFTEVNRISSPSGGSSGGAQSGTLSVSSGQAANGAGSGPHGGVGSVVSIENTSSGDLNQILQNHLTTSADGPYTFIDGRVASGVTGVALVRTDGQDVVSTVADGWFVAWWPGSSDATSAQVTKAGGTTSEPFIPVSEQGMKLPLGQAGSTSGVQAPPPGTCTTTGAPSSSTDPSVNCKSTSTSSKNSGNSGPSPDKGSTGSTGTTGGTGPGSTTKPNA